MNEMATAKVYTNFSSVNEMKLQAKRNDPEAVKAVATQFESLFIEMILATARQANEAMGDDCLGSDQTQFMHEMMDQQLAQNLASQGLGFAKMIEKQLAGLQVIPEKTTT